MTVGWFSSHLAADERAARPSLVTLLGAADGRPVGGGVYLSARSVLTCAHVVNDVLGRPPFHQAPPQDAWIEVAFPGAPAAPRIKGKVSTWIPARRPGQQLALAAVKGDRTWAGDLALLTLSDDPPAQVRAIDWRPMKVGMSVRSWYGGGEEFTFAEALVRSIDADVALLDGDLRGAAIGPGYSGGPLWCQSQQAAVGLVLGVIPQASSTFAVDQVVRRSLAVPWQEIERALTAQTGGSGAVSSTGPGTGDRRSRRSRHADDSSVFTLTSVLHEVMSTAVLVEQARRLSRELRLELPEAPDEPGPGIRELAELLLEMPRAMAVLTEGLLGPNREGSRRLLAVGRALRAPGMLSVHEYDWLTGLLTSQEYAHVVEAARAALPYSSLWKEYQPPEAGAGTAAALIERLEEYWGDSMTVPEAGLRVPALIRVVEFLAASRPEPLSRALRDWSAQVARRLGVSKQALLERRADARTWAGSDARTASRRTRPRLVVELSRQSADRYRCAGWYAPGDGSIRRILADEQARSPAETAALLHEVLNGTSTARGTDSLPVIEVVLPLDDLDLPVDQWESTDTTGLPMVLGVEYPLVLRCLEPRHRSAGHYANWRRRWNAVDRGGWERLGSDLVSVHQVYGVLKTDLSVSRVVLECTPELRPALRAACVLLGIPVVLWDRVQDHPGRADRLTALMINGSTRELPLRLRRQRAQSLAAAAPAALTPSLIWDDIDQPMPESRWRDPSRGGEQP
ncbi:trypsin-like peptidase [Streptomyces sp. 846.5]|nr:trypsin-like peptidase domain-containing protein [Streptomyces sp. 846.5]TDU02111.1 trypsin-like peptidase [Streptomyces sp. 846.5]